MTLETTRTDRLIQWLLERQHEMRLTDVQFANLLNLRSQSHWTHYRNGTRGKGDIPPGLLVDRALEAFPEHREELIDIAYPPRRAAAPTVAA